MHVSVPVIWKSRVIRQSLAFCWSKSACTLVATLLLLLGSKQGALGFSINSVDVNPAGSISCSDEVSLTVTILTPAVPPFLLGTNEVVINRNEVVVVMHPGCGNEDTIGTLKTNVPLGKLRAGSYHYVVVLAPPFSVDWGTLFTTGTFNVMPQLQVGMSPEGLYLSWPSSAEGFVIQYADQLGDATEWKDLSYELVVPGLARVSASGNQKFFRLLQR
jgi:hypothetical protein